MSRIKFLETLDLFQNVEKNSRILGTPSGKVVLQKGFCRLVGIAMVFSSGGDDQ